jgi:hypothetical protein
MMQKFEFSPNPLIKEDREKKIKRAFAGGGYKIECSICDKELGMVPRDEGQYILCLDCFGEVADGA